MSLPFPNVPDVPGVPPLPRLPGVATQVLSLITTPLAGTLWQSSQAPDVWGVFKFNEVDDTDDPDYPGSYTQVIFPDTIIDFGNTNEWDTSNFSIQGGKYAAYNKVKLPFEVSLRFRKTGTASDRKEFLGQIDAIAGDTNLYTIITPEWTYEDVNITRYTNERRGSGSAYSLQEVDVFFTNVPSVTAQYTTTQANTSNAKDATATPMIQQGGVNAGDVDAQTEATAQPAVGFEQ